MVGTAVASHPKPPHGHWIGKIIAITKSSVTLSGIESWEYGSASKKLKKSETFKVGQTTFTKDGKPMENPSKSVFTINEKPEANQDLSKHFKVGDFVTLRWADEVDRDKRMFFDLSKGR